MFFFRLCFVHVRNFACAALLFAPMRYRIAKVRSVSTSLPRGNTVDGLPRACKYKEFILLDKPKAAFSISSQFPGLAFGLSTMS